MGAEALSARATSGTRGRLILGTSGFSYGHWRENFYPPGTPQSRWLEYYATRFSAVELNVSFYRLPKHETFVQWAQRTPDGFEFVVKGSRAITHYKRLKDAEESLSWLFSASQGLAEKVSCFLWQLPPRSAPDLAVLERFCSRLPVAAREAGLAPSVRHAFEFRDPQWFAEPVLDVLRGHGCALVVADPPREGQPIARTADFTYLRFHRGQHPEGRYTKRELKPYAEFVAEALEAGSDAYVFFNNDPGGWAPRDADDFAALVDRRSLSHA